MLVTFLILFTAGNVPKIATQLVGIEQSIVTHFYKPTFNTLKKLFNKKCNISARSWETQCSHATEYKIVAVINHCSSG